MLVEKTNQPLELKNNQFLTETLDDLNEIKQNLLDQIDKDEDHAKILRRIIGKEILREVERINRQKLIEEIRSKLSEYCLIDPTDVTRSIYSESIASCPIHPTAILKFVFDPNHFCLEEIYSKVDHLSQQFINIYSDDVKTTVTGCMLIMTDVVLSNEWTDAYALHHQILQQIVYVLPAFQPSRTIEVERKIEKAKQFEEYFKNLDLFDGETNADLFEQLIKVRQEFSRILSHECFDTLLYRSIGYTSRCPGCGIKCELAAKFDPCEEHHHSSQYHLPMAFNGWPRNEELHPMCYQQWTTKILFGGDNLMSRPEEFFSSEASDWYKDVEQKSRIGEAHLERFPLLEHRGAWMAVRYKLLQTI